MLTVGSRFKARLQVRQNVFSSRFLWNFVVSSCFFLVFQEAEIHSAGLRPSISIYDLHYLHCLHGQVATATPPFRIPLVPSHPHFTFPSLPFENSSPKNPFPRPWPSFFTASTAAPAASSRWTTASWPFCAATCSDVQPGSARRGGWRWRSSKLHGFFDPRRCQRDEKSFLGPATGLGSTRKPALTSHSHQQTRNLSCPSHIHPCTGPVFGPKVGSNIFTWQWMHIKNSLMVPQ